MPTLKIHFKRHRFDESQSGENTVTDTEQELEKQKPDDEIPNEMDDDGIRDNVKKLNVFAKYN